MWFEKNGFRGFLEKLKIICRMTAVAAAETDQNNKSLGDP